MQQGKRVARKPASQRGSGGRSARVQPTSIYKGLAWDKHEGCWRVRVSLAGKQHHLGRCAERQWWGGVVWGPLARLGPSWGQRLRAALNCPRHAAPPPSLPVA